MGRDDLDDLLRRLADDPALRARLEADPAAALRGVELDEGELRRLEEALLGDDVVGFGAGGGIRPLFAPDDERL